MTQDQAENDLFINQGSLQLEIKIIHQKDTKQLPKDIYH